MARTGHSGGSRGWQTTCATPANDARQAHVLTTIAATDNSISIRETGSYRWVVKGQTCAASVLRVADADADPARGRGAAGGVGSAERGAFGDRSRAKLPRAAPARRARPRASRFTRAGRSSAPGDRFGFFAVVARRRGVHGHASADVANPARGRSPTRSPSSRRARSASPTTRPRATPRSRSRSATRARRSRSRSRAPRTTTRSSASRSDAGDDEAAVARDRGRLDRRRDRRRLRRRASSGRRRSWSSSSASPPASASSA